MRRLLGLLAGLAILALFPLAATVSARVPYEGGGKVVRTAGAASGSGSESTSSDPNELSGTLSVSGSTATVTVTAADGTTLSCSIPDGTDLTAFVGQQVKMECDNGVVSEVKNLTTGEEIQPGDDNGGDDTCATTPAASGSDDNGDDNGDDQCDSGSSSGGNDSGDDSGDSGSGSGDGGGDD